MRATRSSPGTACVALMLATTIGAADRGEISEETFLSLLTDDHPAAVALRDELAAAEGDRRTPRTENPGMSFEREAPDGAPAQSTLELSWRPPLDGRRGLANEAAASGLAAAEHRLDWHRLHLRGALRELFARWSLAVEERDLLADVSDRIERLAVRARARASTGEESGLDARRLELEAAAARSALATSEAELLRVTAEIQGLFPGLDTSRRPLRPGLPGMSGFLDTTSRADLTALQLEAEQAELSRRLAGRFLEFPSIVGGWTFVDDDDAGVDGPVLGIEWTIPLFDRQQGERARARRDEEVARARLEVGRARAASDLEAAKSAYESLRAVALDVMATTDGAGTVIEAATAQFGAGEATLTDLLDALRSVTETRSRALELYQEALLAHRRLEISAGRPLTHGDSR